MYDWCVEIEERSGSCRTLGKKETVIVTWIWKASQRRDILAAPERAVGACQLEEEK